jgi:hypothetical protein
MIIGRSWNRPNQNPISSICDLGLNAHCWQSDNWYDQPWIDHYDMALKTVVVTMWSTVSHTYSLRNNYSMDYVWRPLHSIDKIETFDAAHRYQIRLRRPDTITDTRHRSFGKMITPPSWSRSWLCNSLYQKCLKKSNRSIEKPKSSLRVAVHSKSLLTLSCFCFSVHRCKCIGNSEKQDRGKRLDLYGKRPDGHSHVGWYVFVHKEHHHLA